MWVEPKTVERLAVIIDEVKEHERFQELSKADGRRLIGPCF